MDYDSAIAEYTESIRLNPNDASAYYNRGNAYLGKKDYDSAIADYTEAIKLDPDSDVKAEAYCKRGHSYQDGKNDYHSAIADYNEAKRLNPDESSVFISIYIEHGKAYLEKKDYDGAIAYFSEAIDNDTSWAEPYRYRGNAYLGKKDYDNAIADFDTAIVNARYDDYTDPSDYHNRGLAYDAKGNKAKAEEDYAKAKELGYKG